MAGSYAGLHERSPRGGVVALLDHLLEQLDERRDCRLLSPAGHPRLGPGHVLPDDLREFYDRCGGATVRVGHPYGLDLRAPDQLVLSNSLVAGQEAVPAGDISESWYVVASGVGSGIDLISIDLHPDRLGRCYDSFWDVHASPGNCDVVATSFTDLLRRALLSEADSWWWTEDPFEGLGDAYDVT